jgi:hypothetical protein
MTRRDFFNMIEPDRFSRAWWLVRGRDLLFVALVTVLVWVYADVEFTDEMDFRTTVHVGVAPGSNLVLRSESRVEVTFQASGRRSSLERLERRLAAPGTVIRREVTQDQREIDVRDALNRDPFMQNEGLTVLSVSPGTIPVRLDEKIHVPDIPVEADFGGAFVSDQQVTPAKVGIHVAKSDWQQILQAGGRPVLRTVRIEMKAVEPGEPVEVQIIRLIADLPVEPDQPTVKVRAKVTRLTEPKELTVPVQVVVPTSWLEDGTWKQFTLTRRDRAEWRIKIQVSGTRKDLDQIKSEDVLAYVTLTERNKQPVSWDTQPVEIRLPRDLDLKLVSTRPEVNFKLEKTSSPPP